MQQAQFREAVIEYKNAARDSPDRAHVHWKLASAASNSRDIPTAFTALKRVVQLDPAHVDARWSLGDLYLAARRVDEAAKLAEGLISEHPRHPAGYLLRAGVALGEDRVADAIAFLQQAADLDPTMLRPLLGLANLYFTRQDLSAAGEWYARAVAADPRSVEARLAHGYFLCATGSVDEGRREFDQAVELSHDQELVRLLLADRYRALGKRDDAERELTGLMADRNSQKARNALIELKLAAGQVEAAKGLAKPILEADEHDAMGLYFKGRIALAGNDLLEAVSLFERSIGRDATLSASHLYLGIARMAQGRAGQAEDALREAVKLRPENGTAHLALARLYLGQHKSSEAEHEAWQALRSDPSNPEGALLAGDALTQAKQWTKAEDVFGEILRQLPGQSIGYVKLAGLRSLQGRPAEAAVLLSEALARAPGDLAILQDSLRALAESNQGPQAERMLNLHVAQAPHDPNIWRLAGRWYVAQHALDQAERAFRKARALAPDVALTHYELGQFYLYRHQLSAAQSAFQVALKKEETNSEFHTALGMTLASQGQLDAANTQYRRAVQLDPGNVVAANNLAADLSERQDLDDALGLALAALDRAPANPAIKDTLGWIYFKKERFADAQRLLAEASTALPQHPVVRYHHAMTLSKIGKQDDALAELKQALLLPGHFAESDRAARMVAANKIEE
ncbi:MAG: tetratricopeptide repeat protein [Nitrospira sp.]|nr:tetratricopeptide repeat protein [Nitrospira sp.]